MIEVPAWTPQTSTYLSPALDVSAFPSVTGFIGLQPPPASMATGEVTFTWYADQDCSQIMGVKGLPLTSLIPSTAQPLLPNLGPYLQVKYQPFLGQSQLAMRLGPSMVQTPEPKLIPGDAILVDEKDHPLPANGFVTIYPAGYYAGVLRVYLSGSPGIQVSLYEYDLTLVNWPTDSFTNGSREGMAPFGAWFVFVQNVSATAGKFTLAITPDA